MLASTPIWFYNCARSLLGNPTVQKDPQLYLKAVQRVIASMTLGIDVSSLFSEMIKVLFLFITNGCNK